MGASTEETERLDAERRRPPKVSRRPGGGRLAVAAMVGLGLTLATYAVWHQRTQTRRCLALFGAESARRIASSSRVELWRVRPAEREGVLEVVARLDISSAPGLVHLRRGLVEDANYSWPPAVVSAEDRGSRRAAGPTGAAGIAQGPFLGRLPARAWDWAIAFADPPGPVEGADSTVIVVDLPDASAPVEGAMGWLAVRGRPGRVALGRLGPALQRWIKETGGLAPGGEGGKER